MTAVPYVAIHGAYFSVLGSTLSDDDPGSLLTSHAWRLIEEAFPDAPLKEQAGHTANVLAHVCNAQKASSLLAALAQCAPPRPAGVL